MQLVMKHVPGCSAADVDEMIEAIDRQDDNPGCVQNPNHRICPFKGHHPREGLHRHNFPTMLAGINLDA